MLYVSWLDMMELLWDGSSWQTRGSTGREIFVQASRRKIWQTFLFFIWLHGHIDISPRLIKVFWYDHMTMRNVRPVDPLAISGRVIEAWSAVSYRRRRHAFFFTVNVQKAKKITINGKPPFWSWSLTWSHSEDARTLNAHTICWSCIQSGKVNNTCKQKKDKKVNYYSRYFCCRSDG